MSIRPLARALGPLRSLSTTPRLHIDTSEQAASADEKKGFVNRLLHGSETAKHEAAQSHSTAVARGKYVHEIQQHKVKPGANEEYAHLISEYYTALLSKGLPLRLTGSWEVVLGDQDTFYHIWEHVGGYATMDKVLETIPTLPEYATYKSKILPLLQSRQSECALEFSFWNSAAPKTYGGIYELRTYHLKPGSLLEWEFEWRTGVEARRKYVEPIGAWFSQIGELHRVKHIWQYKDLEARSTLRAKAWEVGSWADTVSHTVKLADKMQASIMKPLKISPLK